MTKNLIIGVLVLALCFSLYLNSQQTERTELSKTSLRPDLGSYRIYPSLLDYHTDRDPDIEKARKLRNQQLRKISELVSWFDENLALSIKTYEIIFFDELYSVIERMNQELKEHRNNK